MSEEETLYTKDGTNISPCLPFPNPNHQSYKLRHCPSCQETHRPTKPLHSTGTLELLRLRHVRKHDYYEMKHVPISVFWQVPQYFTFTGQLDFFYEQAPDAMRSLCSALSLTTAALGNYLSTFLVYIVTDLSTADDEPGWIPDNLNYWSLHCFFWLLAGLGMVNLGFYLFVAKCYTYKKQVVAGE